MKCISVFLLSAATLCAADFTTGQAARLVIGQTTFTSQDPNSSDTIVGGVSGLAYAADTLFVVDSNRVGASPINHRVLLFKNASSQIPGPTAELDYTHKCPACVGQATVVLGQPDFTTTTENLAASSSALRQPTAVASDGVHVVIADTNHNRVLIWNRIPTVNNQPADVVVGQADFNSSTLPAGNTPTAKSMRGPQGVWIQNGRLYVADTQNNRVLIYNHIPASNGVAADVVLGAPNFTTFVQPDLTQQTTDASATNMLNPVSVTSDGVRLFVTDLGYNRVLVWNSIPSANDAPADFALGQPDLTSSFANNAYSTDANGVETAVLCTTSNGKDSNGNPTYPNYCNNTLNFPRYALSTGSRLFIADGGNDRVLVYNQMPTQSGAAADYVIGQIGGSVNQAIGCRGLAAHPAGPRLGRYEPLCERRFQPACDGVLGGPDHGALPGRAELRQYRHLRQGQHHDFGDDYQGRHHYPRNRHRRAHHNHHQFERHDHHDHQHQSEVHLHGADGRYAGDRDPGSGRGHQQQQFRRRRPERTGYAGYRERCRDSDGTERRDGRE